MEVPSGIATPTSSWPSPGRIPTQSIHRGVLIPLLRLGIQRLGHVIAFLYFFILYYYFVCIPPLSRTHTHTNNPPLKQLTYPKYI